MAVVGSPGFEEETRVFLQARLRGIQGWVAVMLVLAMLTIVAARTQAGWTVADGFFEFSRQPEERLPDASSLRDDLLATRSAS